MYIYRNFEARSLQRCYCRLAVSITYSKCVFVALGIEHAMRMRRIILPSVSCLDLPHFFTLSHKERIFGKNC